jgi:CelD/BcsL family acetyltransferase involved in cellulose biosynthesis
VAGPLSDTPPPVIERQFELLRRMSPEERLETARQLTLAVQRLAFEGVRRRYPGASDNEVWLRLAARRLGRELVLKIYGFDAGEQ